jgi:D-alanine transaminase
MENVFINGRYLAAEDACLNIEDRGAIFGDGVYEYFKIYQGRIFQLSEHLNRLRYSAGELELPVPYTNGEIEEVANTLVSKAKLFHGGIYLHLTRGTVPRLHTFPENCSPNFFMVAREAEPLPPSLYETGVKMVLVPDDRWKRCDIKTLNLLANVLAKEKAKRLGYYDAILYSERGITESTSSSVLAIFAGVLTVPPSGPWILPGITRKTVLALAGEADIPVDERFFSCEELLAADEILLTSTRIDVLPITQVDGQKIGTGEPGLVAIRLKQRFDQLLASC